MGGEKRSVGLHDSPFVEKVKKERKRNKRKEEGPTSPKFSKLKVSKR